MDRVLSCNYFFFLCLNLWNDLLVDWFQAQRKSSLHWKYLEKHVFRVSQNLNKKLTWNHPQMRTFFRYCPDFWYQTLPAFFGWFLLFRVQRIRFLQRLLITFIRGWYFLLEGRRFTVVSWCFVVFLIWVSYEVRRFEFRTKWHVFWGFIRWWCTFSCIFRVKTQVRLRILRISRVKLHFLNCLD